MLKLKLQCFGHLMQSRIFRKDLDAEKDWRQEETTEDKMVGRHHSLNGHEFEQALGQGSLMCCSPWGHRKSYKTEQLNNKSVNSIYGCCFLPSSNLTMSWSFGRSLWIMHTDTHTWQPKQEFGPTVQSKSMMKSRKNYFLNSVQSLKSPFLTRRKAIPIILWNWSHSTFLVSSSVANQWSGSTWKQSPSSGPRGLGLIWCFPPQLHLPLSPAPATQPASPHAHTYMEGVETTVF